MYVGRVFRPGGLRQYVGRVFRPGEHQNSRSIPADGMSGSIES